MSGDSKPKTKSGVNGGGGFRAKLEHYFYSGDKKHVMVGITLVTAVFAVPWYFMSRGTKQMSHQDYKEKAEKADKARNQRLSSASPK